MMAVAHDAASESHTGAVGSINQASFTWNHTPVGTPKGVLVFVFAVNTYNDYISSVTYGGVSLAAVTGGLAQDTAGEYGLCKSWFLGTGIPAGVQAVVVNRTNNTAELYAVCVTVTALTNTEVNNAGIVLLQEDGVVSEQNVDDGSPGTNSLRYSGIFWGRITYLDPGANSTNLLMGINPSSGSCIARTDRETTAGQGARPVGRDSSGNSDDRAAVHLAIREVAGSGTSISKVATVAQASVKKVSSVAIASVGKVAGVANT